MPEETGVPQGERSLWEETLPEEFRLEGEPSIIFKHVGMGAYRAQVPPDFLTSIPDHK